MRFFHLSDLHIGKHLHHYNLKEDQRHILTEIVNYTKELRPDAVFIAGDIYDKSVPSAEAVEIFDEFLTELSEIKPEIPVLIISGNHDSPERLSYAGGILRKNKIYMSGSVPRSAQEHLKKVTFEDEFGEVEVYLLPFMKPSHVRNLFEEMPQTYTEAVSKVIEREKVNYKKRNVLISHQFYTHGGNGPETCESEMISVGGIDNVDISAIERFDYVALGHIHGAQTAGTDHIRYCGTPLKYSVSEAGHEKSLIMVTLGEKGCSPEIQKFPLHPLYDVRKKTGTLAEIMKQAAENEGQDYVSITLTDEVEPYRPKDQLENVYARILEIRIDNTRTKNKLLDFDEVEISDNPFEAFAGFFEEMQGRKLNENERTYMREIFEQEGENV